MREHQCRSKWQSDLMASIAVIPARGGSKRIPRKNLKLFHGLPIIAYAIKIAKESDIFDEVIVSTDDEEIAEIALNLGATIPWMRPKELADDYATTVSVMQDAVKKLKFSHIELENICCIYPTTPFLRSDFLVEGKKILLDGNWSYVFSGMKVNANAHRFFSLKKSRQVEMFFPQHESTRTQDLKPIYQDVGQFYWGTTLAWELGTPIFSSKSTIVELPAESVIDIDTEDDWLRAELLFETQKDLQIE
jgi:pseudaminic acid cytidylyltransferase